MPLLQPINEALDVGPPVLPEAPRVPLAQVGHLQALPPVRRSRRFLLPRPRLPRRRTLAFVLFVLGGLAFGLLGTRQVEVRPEDRALLPSAVMLGRSWRGFRFEPQAETIEREREWDGTHTLRYHYRPEGDVSMRVLIWDEDSVEAAREAFRRSALHTVFDWGLGLREDVGLVELDPKGTWAQQSAAYRVEREGQTLGYSVSLRQGTRALQARVTGGELRPDALRALFLPFLRRTPRD